jgi:LPXTG-site transpeptidase (sortase) family protein
MRRLLNCLLLLAVVFALSGLAPLAQSALAAPVAASTRSVQVDVAVLNVRGGPGVQYAVVDRATQGTVLDVIGQDAAGNWLHVQLGGTATGWVSALFVSETTPPDPSLPARIVAPAIGLDARVVPAGWHTVRNADGSTGADWDVPANAAGWLITSVAPGKGGNTVLAGHHNIAGQVFRYVVNLTRGDTISLYTGSGTFTYTVVDKLILPDKYVSYKQRVENARWIGPFDDERLTLVTCWPYTNNTHRVIVVAKRVALQ